MRVLVLDGHENQAVAAVRSLGRQGYEVWAGAETSWSKAGVSRFAHARFRYPDPQQAAEEFVTAITELAAQREGTLVLPMTERTTVLLSEQRLRLDAVGARYVLPAHEDLVRAMNKTYTTNLAEQLGIRVPRSVTITGAQSALSVEEVLSYPVVIKAAVSEESAEGGVRATGAPLYAQTRDELLTGVREMLSRARRVIVQEFVEGSGAGFYVLMRQGEVRAEFAHRRLRDVRPTGSGSALRESVAIDPRIRDAGRRIMTALRWHGVAMVEFRVLDDGTPVFIEVNGRFWNSLALAIHAGVDFPALVAELALRGDAAAPASYRTGVRCRWLLGDTRHLAAVMWGAPRGFPGSFPGRLRTLGEFLHPVRGTYHDNFTTTDPLPELADWLGFLALRVPKRLARLRARPASPRGQRAMMPEQAEEP